MGKKALMAALTGAASPNGENEYEFLKGKNVDDILKTKVFVKVLGDKLNALEHSRLTSGNFSGHPIDKLKAYGYWNTEGFIKVYRQVINKESTLPSRLRTFISIIGNDAYVETIKRLKSKTKHNESADI